LVFALYDRKNQTHLERKYHAAAGKKTPTAQVLIILENGEQVSQMH
jgi:hypothetical protein